MIAAWVGMPHATGVTDPHVYTRGCNDSALRGAGWSQEFPRREPIQDKAHKIPRQLGLGEAVLGDIAK